jgi:hypothetical protein
VALIGTARPDERGCARTNRGTQCGRRRYVDLALARADLSALTGVAIDETSYRRGHSYLTSLPTPTLARSYSLPKGAML